MAEYFAVGHLRFVNGEWRNDDVNIVEISRAEEQLIKELSAIDSVKVVRCKDCKYHHWEQEPCHGKIEHYCELPHMRGIEVFEEFFCYYGKQKEYDNNG